MSNYNKQKYMSNKINNYYKDKHKKKVINNSLKNKRIGYKRNDEFGKVYCNITSRIFKIFKRHNIKFDISYDEVIRCDKEKLKEHINGLLLDDMTYDNYGLWEVDHIKPVSKFNFNNRDEIFECFNYVNLQPLWKEENRSKFNKI